MLIFILHTTSKTPTEKKKQFARHLRKYSNDKSLPFCIIYCILQLAFELEHSKCDSVHSVMQHCVEPPKARGYTQRSAALFTPVAGFLLLSCVLANFTLPCWERFSSTRLWWNCLWEVPDS